MHRTFLSAVLLLLTFTADAAEKTTVKTKDVDYKVGDTALRGMLAWDDAQKGKRPGVIVIHEWWGHNDHARNSARKLAEAGYVAFALDMYGKGKLAAHPKDAEAFMKAATADPAVVKARFEAAVAELKKSPHVDASRVGAIGYCMGGGMALGLARAGEDLKAVAAFHGLSVGDAKKGTVKAAMLLLEGGADPMITAADIDSFKKEMDAAGATYEVVVYPGVKHGYTNPVADSWKLDGAAYDADAAKRSWDAMLAFFKQKLG